MQESCLFGGTFQAPVGGSFLCTSTVQSGCLYLQQKLKACILHSAYCRAEVTEPHASVIYYSLEHKFSENKIHILIHSGSLKTPGRIPYIRKVFRKICRMNVRQIKVHFFKSQLFWPLEGDIRTDVLEWLC